jgi:hypothetical protein
MFKEYVAATSLPKRLIVIHGVGGVGNHPYSVSSQKRVVSY